jgi:hypothetical protein
MQQPKHAFLPILLFLLSAFFSNVSADSASEAADRLLPLDTSSPRALIDGMRRGLDQALALYLKKRPIRRQVQRLSVIFDFSETPPALIRQQGKEHFWQLVDIVGCLPDDGHGASRLCPSYAAENS